MLFSARRRHSYREAGVVSRQSRIASSTQYVLNIDIMACTYDSFGQLASPAWGTLGLGPGLAPRLWPVCGPSGHGKKLIYLTNWVRRPICRLHVVSRLREAPTNSGALSREQ